MDLYEKQRALNVEARERRQLIRELEAAQHALDQTRSCEDIEDDVSRVNEQITERIEGMK